MNLSVYWFQDYIKYILSLLSPTQCFFSEFQWDSNGKSPRLYFLHISCFYLCQSFFYAFCRTFWIFDGNAIYESLPSNVSKLGSFNVLTHWFCLCKKKYCLLAKLWNNKNLEYTKEPDDFSRDGRYVNDFCYTQLNKGEGEGWDKVR